MCMAPTLNPLTETYLSMSDQPTVEQIAFCGRCEAQLGITFQNKQYLLAALTHASGAKSSLDSNERLEFLGDAVLGFCVCCYLYERFPNWNEGELTTIKSAVVSRQSCFQWAQRFNLAELIQVGKGISTSQELPRSVSANGFEALIAAIYLDQGLPAAEQFLRPLIESRIEEVLKCSVANNFKSALQQVSQRDFGQTPTYTVIDQTGPDHAKSFLVAATIGTRRFPPAWGRSKKEAEQRAAGLALEMIEAEEGDALNATSETPHQRGSGD